MTEDTSKNLSFEKAYTRLEKILEDLSAQEVPLEKALTLYEEADRLIKSCTHQLSHAEQKIQTLVKSRDGDLKIDPTSKDPLLETFEPTQEEMISRELN